MSCFMGAYQNYHVRVGETLLKITDFNPKHKEIFQAGDAAFVRFDVCDAHIL
ncbi:MAG: TOBE domain-containing protein [Acetivibrio ethanolgignens]